ncbi:MAG: hypothetical protein K5879_02325 [Lachnospiraceae bacterium]|nr:hypothetical protein [Lachnospiraceae bacterium]
MNKKKLPKKSIHLKAGTFAALLFLCASLLFSGCSEILSLFEDSSETLPYFPVNPGSETDSSSQTPSSEPESGGTYDFPVPDTSETNTNLTIEWTKPDLPDFSSDESPVISNDRELNAYMEYILRNRIQSFSFYSSNGFTIDNDLLLYRFSLPYVSTNYTIMRDQSEYWNVFIMYYPGTMIADAYESGDSSGLTDDEMTVLEMTSDFIENTVNPEENILVKERLIHDYICRSTVYYNPGSEDPVPRYCTVTGLLLDGKANCQGYADAFNMLCKMAGLQSKSQSGSAEGNLHVWNIISLDGIWYSVDVTYDDTTFNSNGYYYPAYIYFNAGKDILEETHYIPKGNELTRISMYSDDNYFYYSGLFTDAGYCDAPYEEDVAFAEQEIAELLCDAYENGYETVSYLVRDRYLDSHDIVNVIQGYIPEEPNPITVSTYHVGKDTYICGEPR